MNKTNLLTLDEIDYIIQSLDLNSDSQEKESVNVNYWNVKEETTASTKTISFDMSLIC